VRSERKEAMSLLKRYRAVLVLPLCFWVSTMLIWSSSARGMMPRAGSSSLDGIFESTRSHEEREPGDSFRNGKGVRRAVLFSLLLPGSGQYYLGEKVRGRRFMYSELAAWVGFGALQLQGRLRRDGYEQYAELFAGAERGMNDEYYRAVGRFLRSDPPPASHNEDVRRDARARYPNDREAQKRYEREHGYWGEAAWNWESPGRQDEYLEMRKASNRSFHRSYYFIAVMIVNHMVSAIDAARLSSRGAGLSGDRERAGWEVKLTSGPPVGYGIMLTKRF